MWLFYTLMTFVCWGVADLFYKLGNKGEGEYNHLKTGIFVGVVMGIHATGYLIVNHLNVNFMDMLKYLPVSFCYISSMVIGYRGLKYLELSISSPVQNTSGVITAVLLILIFKETMDLPFYVACILIFIGILLLSLIELKENKEERKNYRKNNKVTKVVFLTILFPIAYCLLDGVGTFLDGIYLDKMELISEDSALLCYEYTFLVYAIITFIYLKLKNVKISVCDEKSKLFAALFETGGQFTYVFAMAGNSVISAPIVGSYAILSLLLSRLFLKEKLSFKQYFAITLVLIGIVILAILDI